MWNAWTAPPGALPHDYDPWSCEAHCARCGELAQDCHCDEDDMSEPWQPIETAPRMRKVIVFYRNALGKGRTVMACYYLANALEMHDDYADVGTYNEATGNSFAPEGWYEEHDSEDPIIHLQGDPTHWMPLPAAPGEDHTS